MMASMFVVVETLEIPNPPITFGVMKSPTVSNF